MRAAWSVFGVNILIGNSDRLQTGRNRMQCNLYEHMSGQKSKSATNPSSPERVIDAELAEAPTT